MTSPRRPRHRTPGTPESGGPEPGGPEPGGPEPGGPEPGKAAPGAALGGPASGASRGSARRRGGGGRDNVPGHPEDHVGDPESVARAICLRLLTAAPRTRAQLAQALRRRAVPDDAAQRVLERFTDVGLIDDRTFAQAWVSSRHHGRGLARRALSRELRQRGVDTRTAEEAVQALDEQTEEATARALVRRRLRSTRTMTPEARARRLVAMLARKGYPPSVAYRVVREELEHGGVRFDGEWYPEEQEDEPHPDVEP